MSILDTISTHRIVPVVVLDNVAHAAPLAQALVDGGLPLAEVTFRTAGAAESIRVMAAHGDLIVGAGTVLTVAQVNAAVGAGAQYIVSPGTSAAVVNRCQELGVMCIPGAVTATEIMAALELGLDTVKFFPAEASGGLSAIKALVGPFGNVRFVPTGGIDTTNLHEYLETPAVLGVGGSWMLPKRLIVEGQFELISEMCREAVQVATRLEQKDRGDNR